MRYIQWLLPALLIAGGLLRVAVWLQNRTLFMDEANLARNLCALGLGDFFGPLKHDQFAPPLFLVLEKLPVLTFGCSEQAMRFIPLLASLTALPLFWAIARRFVPNVAVLWWPILVFAFSSFFLRYGTELKQYSTDILTALLLIWLALRMRPDSPRSTGIWAIIGVVSIWFSMPSVFVLAGVGAYFLVQNFEKSDRALLQKAGIVGVAWLVSFAAYYFLMLQKSVANPMLQEHHAAHFLPLVPTSTTDLVLWKNLLSVFPYYAAGFTAIALAFGSAGTLAGVFFGFQKRNTAIWLLIGPVMACLLASGFGRYSLMPRLLAWAFPLTMILMAYGVSKIWDKATIWLRAALLMGMVLSASLHEGYRFFVQRFADEGLKKVLAEMKAHAQPNDLIVVDESAKAAFVFYRDHSSRREAQFSSPVLLANWDFKIEPQSFVQNGQAAERVWFVFAQVISTEQRRNVEAKLELMRQLGRQENSIEQAGAAAYLFSK